MDSKRIPPQNVEAECSVLGGLLLDQDAWDEVSDTITEKDFYKPAHQKIFIASYYLNLYFIVKSNLYYK